MKNMSLLFAVLIISFSNIRAREAYQPAHKVDWENPKSAQSLILKIESKIKQLNKEKAINQDKLRGIEGTLTEKQKDKISKTINDLDSRIVQLNISKADIERLGIDKAHVYHFVNAGSNCVFKGIGNNINIQGVNDALLIHEIRHVSLSLQSQNGLRFSKNNLLLPVFADGSTDELQGYRAQYAFEPNSLPGVYPQYFVDINLEYISNIKKEDGSYAYAGIRKTFLDDRNIAESKKKLDVQNISQTNVLTHVAKN